MRANLETICGQKIRFALRRLAFLLSTTTAIVGITAPYGVSRAHPSTRDLAVLSVQPQPVVHTVASRDPHTKAGGKHRRHPARTLASANPAIPIKPPQPPPVTPPPEQTPPQPSTLAGSPQPAPKLKYAVAPSNPSARTADSNVWDRLARCESRGNWSSNVGTFDGGLQFHPRTWKAYGGTRYAPSANQATREQQIAVAERVLARQGWRAWPACSRRLGLR